MISDVIDLLRCPRCAQPLTLQDRTAGCASRHRFDLARQGQLNLMRTPPGATSDTAAMVADRAAFLATGHYAPIADLVARAATGHVAVEAGAGTGYYLSAVLTALGARPNPPAQRMSPPFEQGMALPPARGIATDLSAYACRRSAKLLRVGAVVADTWAGLPVRDGAADTVLTVFAPRNWAEFARISSRQGRVLVVTPQPGHLAEVRHTFGLLRIEKDKLSRLLTDASPWMLHEGNEELDYRITLAPGELASLIGMGPNAFHTRGHSPGIKDPIGTTVSVRLDVFRPRS